MSFADATWTGDAGDNCLNTSGNWNNGVPSGATATIDKDAGPLAVGGSFETVAPGAAIEVTADPGWPVGSRVTLVEAKSSGQMGNLKLVGGDNLKVYRSGNAIMARKLGGMCMILR